MIDEKTTFELFPHQVFGIAKGRIRSMAFFWEMGTGKTIAALNVIPNDAGLSVILCPISVLTSWQVDAAKARKDIKIFTTIGLAERARNEVRGYALRAAANRPTILVINYEQAAETAKYLKAAKIFLRVAICDESSYIKNIRAQRTKGALALRELAERGYVLSGTPVTQGLLDLYAQMKFVDAGIFTENWWGFRARYAKMGGFKNKQVVGYKNVDRLLEKIKPWSQSVKKEDVCKDLPEKIYMQREVELTDAEKANFQKIKHDCIVSLPAGEPIPLVNALAVIAKLIQASSGFCYYTDPINKDQRALEFGATKRNEARRLLTDGELLKVPTVIWSIFTFEAARMAAELRADGVEVVMAEKGVSALDAARFFTEGKGDVLIANPQSLGYGVNLQRATAEIFLSNSYKYGDREQAEARCHRIGQRFPVTIIDIVAIGAYDKKILNIIKKKGKLADFVKDELGVELAGGGEEI